MLVEHLGKSPKIHPSAWIAPDATVCGDVEVGEDCRIGFGARLVAEGAPIRLGKCCIVMENAVLRAPEGHALTLGEHCLIGPHAHLAGCRVGDRVFIATGASVFHSAELGSGCEVRINGVVQILTQVPPGATVPIGWVAVGQPAQFFPPDRHEEIWAIQKPLNFPKTVYGVERSAEDGMGEITRIRSGQLGRHTFDSTMGE